MTAKSSAFEARAGRMRAALGVFKPTRLDITDESARHEGHAGAREAGETHFRLAITSAAFAGKTRIESHRMINAALKEEWAGGLHALTIIVEKP